jgi:Domain of unknown function (DUF4282)
VQRGFFGSLFDLSFTSFVTTKLIKVLYVLSLVILAIAYVVIAIAFFTSGGGDSVTIGDDGSFETDSGGSTALGLLWLFVLGPLFLFFYTLAYRVLFELVVVLFRIFENTRDQLAVTRAAWPAAAAPPSAGDGESPVPPAG